jgi:hypothetical protein
MDVSADGAPAGVYARKFDARLIRALDALFSGAPA